MSFWYPMRANPAEMWLDPGMPMLRQEHMDLLDDLNYLDPDKWVLVWHPRFKSGQGRYLLCGRRTEVPLPMRREGYRWAVIEPLVQWEQLVVISSDEAMRPLRLVGEGSL